jgi:hypothetical protein
LESAWGKGGEARVVPKEGYTFPCVLGIVIDQEPEGIDTTSPLLKAKGWVANYPVIRLGVVLIVPPFCNLTPVLGVGFWEVIIESPFSFEGFQEYIRRFQWNKGD